MRGRTLPALVALAVGALAIVWSADGATLGVALIAAGALVRRFGVRPTRGAR